MDKRSEQRIPRNVRFFVHVHDCEADPDLVGISIRCEAVDFSPHGMQLKTDEALEARTLLNITIGIGEPFAMYLLRGEVRWQRQAGDDDYRLGIMLHETEGTDFEIWAESFDEIFTA